MKLCCYIITLLLLSACTVDRHVQYTHEAPKSFPKLVAVGYAPVSSQPGKTRTERMINAMKASKMEAYRELAEQVYGQHVQGQQRVADLVMASDNLKARVDGVVRGAQVIKTYAVGDDSYATEMALDMKRVYDLYLIEAQPVQQVSSSYFH